MNMSMSDVQGIAWGFACSAHYTQLCIITDIYGSQGQCVTYVLCVFFHS